MSAETMKPMRKVLWLVGMRKGQQEDEIIQRCDTFDEIQTIDWMYLRELYEFKTIRVVNGLSNCT